MKFPWSFFTRTLRTAPKHIYNGISIRVVDRDRRTLPGFEFGSSKPGFPPGLFLEIHYHLGVAFPPRARVYESLESLTPSVSIQSHKQSLQQKHGIFNNLYFIIFLLYSWGSLLEFPAESLYPRQDSYSMERVQRSETCSAA